MYKLLLCWRYLWTRYLALACIISVMLGVATLIVVNSVMSGFSSKLKERLHGLLSDIIIEGRTYDGFPNADEKIRRIMASKIGDKIEAVTPTVEVFAMMQYRYQGQVILRPVHLIGIDPEGRASVGGFSAHLVLQKDDPRPNFQLTPEMIHRYHLHHPPIPTPPELPLAEPGSPPPVDPPQSTPRVPKGIIIGHALASYRDKEAKPGDKPEDIYILHPGDEVILTTVSGERLMPVFDSFVIRDYFKSEMSEYDSSYVFVPLDHLQHLRTMSNRVTNLQIKLKDYRDLKLVKSELQSLFPASHYQVSTWEDKQGPLLAAIDIEKGILNILLFLIIAVAGFGILAIFTMIVVEKTRDIGILKALGASNGGVMAIFLGYGLLLGVVGAILGTGLGLALTENINEIEKFLAQMTGREIFDRRIYYFDEIPTDLQPLSVVLVNIGAIAIAVTFSILPALRAALLHPVRALRYE
ncbi:MAG: ABC transporter permease [Gemmataceae bacterium]